MMSTRKSAVLALTLATGPLLIASTAHAAPSCGTPAVEAVYTTVHHDAESVVTGQHKVVDQPAQPAVPAVWATESYVITPAVPAVPAVTAQETQWTVGNSTGPDGDGWATTGQTKDHAAVTQTRYQWEKVTTTTQYEWVIKVIDQPETTTIVHHDAVYRDVVVPATYKDVVDVPEHVVHHDAVYDTSLYQYVNKQGRTQFQPLGWNTADGHDQGWNIVTPYVHPVVTEAWDETVPATYKQEVDVPEHTVQELVTAAYDQTVTTPEKSHYDKQWTTSPTEAPADGWVRSATEPLVTTETDTVFTVDDETAPEGYSLVGQETTVLEPAYTEYEWARTVVVTPAQPEVPAVMGERQVLVSPEVPATDEVSHMDLYLYELKNGDTKWKPFGWNTADGHDQGWDIVVPYVHPVVTEAWDETVTTPEKSHYDKQWTNSPTEAPADGWVRSATEPLVTTETDTVFTVDDETAPEGYSLVGQETTVLKPAYTEYEWARTVVVTPAQPEVPAVMGERQVLVSPEVPATDEVSHMEDTIVTTPAYDTQELVTPAVPAGEACPVISTGGEEIAGPGGSGDPKTTSSASAVPTLAFTGFDPELYVAGSLVLLFVGSGLTVVARRREN